MSGTGGFARTTGTGTAPIESSINDRLNRALSRLQDVARRVDLIIAHVRGEEGKPENPQISPRFCLLEVSDHLDGATEHLGGRLSSLEELLS